tara:strand:+ start:1395 stop:1979 length:585 start_codon:yes stop_codon:yes gene_type:complete
MANQLNTGSLESLQKGQTLLLEARKVSGGKIQLEFAEIIKTNDRGENVLSILNKSDDRFSSNARRSWSTAEPIDAEEAFGVNFGADAGWYASEKGEMLELNILNPTINGNRCRVLVNETTEPNEWQAENIERSAKRKGKEGPFITHNGDYIFSNTEVVLNNGNTDDLHVFLAPDSTTLQAAVTQSQAFDDEVGI